MDKLFVYGIFLGDNQRVAFGMVNPRYAVVHGYKTVRIAQDIVEAVRDDGADLTGLLVDIPRAYLDDLDSLERGYTRVKEKTLRGEKCWMYVG